ncbi:MAG TPA: inorganic diphosphatase, partial [Thermoanaerobaculia bacterium]|nr:inorganic diphosphatase [Thermoanaerobaculia bacterium]
MGSEREPAWELLRLLFKPHPWHGVTIGAEAPAVVTAYVEIVPSDTVKFEIDKPSGLLKVDRPQQFSNVCPTLYGFVPQTFCGERVAALSRARTGREKTRGDGDPLDIGIVTENAFPRGDVLLQARP